VDTTIAAKGVALLRFLKDAATLRRKRVPSYGPSDKVVWFGQIPAGRPECRSAFLADNPTEFPDLWLEVRKKRTPTRPPVPKIVADWVRPEDLDQVDQEPALLPEITVLVEKPRDPDTPAATNQSNSGPEKFPQLRRLKDYPEVEDAWLEYLVNQWEPWSKEMRLWQDAQRIYEDVDFMRRRLEESEERYELLLGFGLLQWRDSTGAHIRRHIFTGPAEIGLDAARGILSVAPAAAFESFRMELDMLELHDRPRLDDEWPEPQLEALDIGAWDAAKVGEILHGIANRVSSKAQVDEKTLAPADRTDEIFRLAFAPALVLRERRPTAYEELVNRLLNRIGDVAPNTTTRPWERFLREGAPSDNSTGPANETPVDQIELGAAPARLLFPLPTNDEQRQIAGRLELSPYVLVKGPPGTGKSLTIANLICHLLASGERILITAHAPKALSVLRGLLPDDMRALCVMALGSSREDQHLLEEGVRGILSRQNDWHGDEWARTKIDEIERELQHLENELAQSERRLRESREAETHRHTLPGGYEGTAAAIARRIEQERPLFGWFPEGSLSESPFPFQSEDVRLIAEIHTQLSAGQREELTMDVGSISLPGHDEFSRAVADLESAQTAVDRALRGASQEQIDSLQDCAMDALEKTRASLDALEKSIALASRSLGALTDEIVKDLLVGNQERWNRLVREVPTLLKPAAALRNQLGSTSVELPTSHNGARLRADAERRLGHFKAGGRLGFSILAPRIVRETRYVVEQCKVDGQPPVDLNALSTLLDFLQLASIADQFTQLWPAPVPNKADDPRRLAAQATDLANALLQLFGSFVRLGSDCFPVIPVADRVNLASRAERVVWLNAVEANIRMRHARSAQQPFERWALAIRSCLETERPHPSLLQLHQTLEKRDVAKWKVSWTQREHIRIEKERLARYESLIGTLDRACPGLAAVVLNAERGPDGKAQLLQLERAWAWGSACSWVRRVSDANAYRTMVQFAHHLHRKIEDKTKALATIQAWRVFFNRLDDATVQNLNAWTKAIGRIGKGTGKYAYRNRRTAREYLNACTPKMPAWIMPLHKLWDTVDAEPGQFDTVIVDEASQAGIESLALLLLAKRIVVVGDDMQNSPEGVGIDQNDIARLAREHLGQFRFHEEFRPDTSLFDHAMRAFGNQISLREHFRCVPEIIRFSNDLCYKQVAPLIPLRQAPPNRLVPLRSSFVPTGACEGSAQRIRNRAEAEALVQAVRKCIEDENFEGKTMGVIALQGHAQAELIGNILAQKLDPKIIEERRLRCGVPATFQGDQRDVIFLSLVVAPNVHYVALDNLPAQRRFNVAMSRARDQVWLFHSVQQHDLSPQCLRRRLLGFFQNQGPKPVPGEDSDRLDREIRQRPRQPGSQPEPYDSWFEVDVALELLHRNFRVHPQYELAGYRIDMVVEDLVSNSRLAVECDGETWHGPERYERDMARQRQLERADLTFVRIRESEYYADRPSAVQRILEACESLGIQSADHSGDSGRQERNHDVFMGSDAVANEAEPGTEPNGVEADSEEVASATEFGPFTGYSEASEFPDPRDASPANVRDALSGIVQKDGPLTRASIFRLYVEGCRDLHRAGKTVRESLNRALGAMLRAGEIVQDDELGDGSPDSLVVRLAGAAKVQERPAGRRDLVEIPPSELHLILGRLAPASVGSGDENDELLFRKVIEHYGFGRLTGLRRKYLFRVIKALRH
jgi:very-short-patch-repair endonuclease